MRTQRSKFNLCAFRNDRNERAISFGDLCIGASGTAPHISYRLEFVPELIFTLTVRPNGHAWERGPEQYGPCLYPHGVAGSISDPKFGRLWVVVSTQASRFRKADEDYCIRN